jgi:subtilisin family serine protease
MHVLRGLSVSALMLSVPLAGCGGGGGGGGSSVPQATPTPVPTATPAPTTCTSIATSPSGGRRGAVATGSLVSSNQLYVTYRSSSGRGVQAIDRAAGVVRALDLGASNGVAHRAVTVAAGADLSATTAQLRALPDVVDVAPVHLRVPLAVPNDPLYENVDQWYLFRTNASAGWALSQGNGIAVAVIDTGVDEQNPDLAPKLDVHESVINGTVSTAAGSAQDTDGHGTNVAGLATAATNNGYGFAGVGFNARLQAYRIFQAATAANPCPTASTADEAGAIRDAVANGASVISLSIGGRPTNPPDQAESQAVAFAIANNVTVVAAGGNGGDPSPDAPGAYPGVIAVGASSAIDAVANVYASITGESVASYSDSGVTLVAPGGDPSSTTKDQDDLHWIEGYSTTPTALPANQCSGTPVCRVLFAGTSQATPQVSGTVALMMAYHGGAKSLSPAMVTQLLTSTADSIGQPAGRQGAGRLNIGRAVAAAHP